MDGEVHFHCLSFSYIIFIHSVWAPLLYCCIGRKNYHSMSTPIKDTASASELTLEATLATIGKGMTAIMDRLERLEKGQSTQTPKKEKVVAPTIVGRDVGVISNSLYVRGVVKDQKQGWLTIAIGDEDEVCMRLSAVTFENLPPPKTPSSTPAVKRPREE